MLPSISRAQAAAEVLLLCTSLRLAGVAIGLALIMYGCEESAEPLIEQMTGDQDPILRYGGMYVIGMAYR